MSHGFVPFVSHKFLSSLSISQILCLKYQDRGRYQNQKKTTLPDFVKRIIMERRQKLYHNKERNFERRTLNSLVKKHGQDVDEDSDLMNYDQRPPAHLKGKAIGLWYRDRQIRKQKAESRVKLTKQERAVMQIKKHFYKIELPADKEYHINVLLGEIRRSNPAKLPCFEDEGSPPRGGRGKKNKKDDVAFTPYYGPSTSKGGECSRNTTSELRGQVEEKYKHVEDSAFKRNFLSSISGTLEEKIEKALLTNYRLVRDQIQDAVLKKDMIRKLQSPKYQEMLEARQKLPAFKLKDEILNLIEHNQICVISGETGCGKTTQVPQFILDDQIARGQGSQTFIMITQPRRISAIAIAERVAQERDEAMGKSWSSVGYQIRLEKQMPRKEGAMLYCTAGILPEIMQNDPILSGVSHVVMDEIHERSMISDFLLALLKDITKKRKDLKLILMSATLNAEKFSQFFDGAPILHIPGFTYPVEEFYLEDVLLKTRFKPDKNSRGQMFRPTRDQEDELQKLVEPYIRTLRRTDQYPAWVLNMLKNPEFEGVNIDVIVSLLQHIAHQKPGAVLVFLPGWDTISALHKTLTKHPVFNNARYLILPLHSMLPTVSQRVIFDRPRDGVRKIVLATNIAETSITIDDVVYVIDCGMTKMNNFDVKDNVATLKSEWISLANAKQRRGRAGRVQDGVCYHLYSRAREESLQAYPLPEIQRTRLDEVVLKGKMLQVGQIATFLQKLLDPPDPASVKLSLKMLRYIDALDDDEHLTPLGFHLAKLPLDPQIGKMLLMASIFSCVDPVFTVAASLGFKDAFYTPMNMEKEVDKRKEALAEGAQSDYAVLINAMRGWEQAAELGNTHDYCRENYLTNTTLQMLREMKDQFTRHMFDMRFVSSREPKANDSNINSNNVALVNAVIASGLYPNVGVVKRTRFNSRTNQHYSSIVTPDDGKVSIHPKSVNSRSGLFDSPFIMYYQKLKSASSSVNLHDTSQVYPLPMIFFAHDMKSMMKAGTKQAKYKMNNKKATEIITVRDCLNFECKPSTAKLIKELRSRLDMLLAHKLSHPGTTEWKNSNEGNILLAIIELITNEDKRNSADDYSDEEGDDQADDEFVSKI